MLDLQTQLTDYLDHVVQRVTVEDILEERVGQEPVRFVQPRRPQRGRRWVYGVAAAALVLLLLGGVGWLTRSSSSEVVDQPTPTTAAPPVSTAVPQDPDVFPAGSAAYGVAASDSIVVVVGTDVAICCGTGVDGDAAPDSSAAVWTSSDAVNWTRVPHDEAVFGGPSGQVMHSVAATPAGFVAGGTSIWTSPDGLTWSRVPESEVQLPSATRTDNAIRQVLYWQGSIYAFGAEFAWASTDGVTWTRSGRGLDHRGVVATPTGLQFDLPVRAVVPVEDGYVGLGTEDGDYGLWRSSDGLTWNRDESMSDLIVPGVVVSGITEFQGRLIAAGIGGQAPGYRAAAQPIGEHPPLDLPQSRAGLISPDRWSIAALVGEASAEDVAMIVDELGARPGVVDIVQMPADWSLWHAVTGLHACVPGTRCGEGFVLLVEQDQLAQLRTEMESRFGSPTSDVMVSETIFQGVATEYVRAIASPSAHPEPAFDTSVLGAEQALTGPIDAEEAVPELSSEFLSDSVWVAAARQESTNVAAAWWLEADLGLNLTVDSGGVSADPPLPYLVTALWSEDRSSVAIGGLPPEASAVAVTLDNGTSVWQRPIGGLVVIDVRPGISDRIRILDSAGSEILGVEEARPDEWNIVLPDD